DFGASKRTDIKEALPSVDLRRKFWESFFADPRVDKASTRSELEDLYQETLKEGIVEQGRTTWIDFGDDVELLPIKALRLMQEAEWVLYPQECPFSFVDLVRRDAERELYTSDAELADKLSKAKQAQLRVVVFVAPNTAQYC
ncbi:ferrochelatase, partial [Vibrio xuii]